MELERIKEILKERGFFRYDAFGGVEIIDDMLFESYIGGKREGDFVEIGYFSNSDKADCVFISNPYYNFCTDEQNREGINLGDEQENKLSEELFTYCLDIQENPELHEINFCKAYLKFAEWRNNELIPIIKYLELETEENDYIEIDSLFPFQTSFCFYKMHINNLFIVETRINSLTLEVSLIMRYSHFIEDLSTLYGSPSDIILSAIEEFKEEIESDKMRS